MYSASEAWNSNATSSGFCPAAQNPSYDVAVTPLIELRGLTVELPTPAGWIGDDHLDPATIGPQITPRTRAIYVMDYGGLPNDMDAIMAIARKHGLAVVEDAAHSPGAAYRGRP